MLHSFYSYKSRNKEIILLAITSIIAFVWVFGQHLTFGMDSKTYLQYANWLAGRESISSCWYIRTPGLPLFLILCGVTKFQSFIGFMFFQTIVSVLIVWLCYKIALAFDQKNALKTAYFCIFTCIPFIFSSAVMTEHLNLFGFCWLLFSLIYFHHSQSIYYVRMVAFATILLFLMRPSNYYIFIISLAFVAFFSTSQRRKYVSSFLLIYLSFMAAYMFAFSLLKMSHPGNEGLSSVFQGVRSIAYVPYKEHAFNNPGTSSLKLSTTVSTYLNKLESTELESYGPHQYFGVYATNKDLLLRSIFMQPNGYYYNFITSALTNEFGRKEATAILLKASIESFWHKPKTLFTWFKTIFSSSTNNYTGQMLFYQFMLKAGYVARNESEGFNSKINAENGLATAEIIKHVRNFVMLQNKWLSWEPKELFADFKEKPEDFLSNLFTNPSHIYHWFIWQAVDREAGPLKTADLFLKASIEGFKTHPIVLITYLDDLIAYFLGPDVTYKNGARVIFLPNTGMGEKTIIPSFSNAMREQINEPLIDISSTFWQSLYLIYGVVWLIIKPLVFLLSFFWLFKSYRTKHFKLNLLLWVLIVYNASIVTVFADPFFRYSAVTLLIAVFGGSQILYKIALTRQEAAMEFSDELLEQKN